MNEELKACSHCGSNNLKLDTLMNNGKKPFRFECIRCDYSPDWWEETEEEAAKYWNTRPLEDALRAELTAKDAEIERLQTWLDEAQSACKGLGQTADNFGARLNAARAEVERLRGIIRGAENIQQEWARQSIRVCCDSRPGDEHEPDCPFYQWEGTE